MIQVFSNIHYKILYFNKKYNGISINLRLIKVSIIQHLDYLISSVYLRIRIYFRIKLSRIAIRTLIENDYFREITIYSHLYTYFISFL